MTTVEAPAALDNPFVGPVPYARAKERTHFFGRDREIAELISYVFSERVVMLYSASGAGKSSLMNAGVIPELEERHEFQVLPVARVRGRGDLAEAHTAASFYAFQAILHMRPELPPGDAAGMTFAQFLQTWDRPLDEDGQPVPRLLVFDQFEEVLAVYSNRFLEHQQALFRQLAEALAQDARLRIVWLVREDRVSQMETFAGLLPQGLGLRYRLEQLAPEEALRAILGITASSAKPFTEDAARGIVEQLKRTRAEVSPGTFELVDGTRVEPVQLQVVCRSVWERSGPGPIEASDVVQHGDISDLLAQYYDGIVARICSTGQVDEGDLRTWFSRRLITEVRTRGTVFRGPELTDEAIPNSVVDELERLHLIRAERREGGGRWYELVHDTFIDPILRVNDEWQGRQEPQALAVIRVAAPLVVVAVVGLLTLTWSWAPSSLPQDPPPPVLRFSGTTGACGAADSHAVPVVTGSVAVTVVPTGDGEIRDVRLQDARGQDVPTQDLDPSPTSFSGVFTDLPDRGYQLVVEGPPSAPVTYTARVFDGQPLETEAVRRADLSDGNEGRYLLVGTGAEVLVTARAREGVIDPQVDVFPLDGGASLNNDDAEFALPQAPRGFGGNRYDSGLYVLTREGQPYGMRVSALGGETDGAYAVTTEPTGQSGRLAPGESERVRIGDRISTLSLTSPDRTALRLTVQDSTAGRLVDELVSPLDLAGLTVALTGEGPYTATVSNTGAQEGSFFLRETRQGQ